MHRRTLLAALGTGVAGLGGCSLGTSGDGSASPFPQRSETPSGSGTTVQSPTPEETATPEEPEIPDDAVAVIDLETGPRTVSITPLYFSTDDRTSIRLWFERTATSEHPAQIRGWLRNDNDFANTVRIKDIPAIGHTQSWQPAGEDHEARLHLAPTERNELATELPTPTRGEDGYWRVADIGPWMAETRRLDPGEFVELAYALVSEPGSPGRPTGTYEFQGDPTVAIHVWDADTPGPEQSSRFAGRSVPEVSEKTETAWYHELGPSTTMYLEPTVERIELDGRIDFEIYNHSHESVQCGHWNLYKLVDSDWYHVDPNVHLSDCRSLEPGASMAWALRAFNGEPVPCDTGTSCADGLTRGYLGGGEYAVVAGYGQPADASAALVEFVGDPAPVLLTDDAKTERDGDAIDVTTDRYGDGERPDDAVLTLERAETAEERLLAEQVMSTDGFMIGPNALRNALAAMGTDVGRVVVHSDQRAVDRAVGYDGDSRRFQFRGQAYEALRGVPGEN
ncbi:hypothetical protein [Halorhabdus salina]|uniref:hypothetical protein n=1 Tax=Halorhabdus salina TaxID=2750670 RepID=UPI0015EE69C7|nr:hypothetical protein [Halorhabdus salina]